MDGDHYIYQMSKKSNSFSGIVNIFLSGKYLENVLPSSTFSLELEVYLIHNLRGKVCDTIYL